MWLQCEMVAAATDVAEFVGAAAGLNLLFGIPLFMAGILTAAVSFGLLELQRRGASRFEATMTALLGVIAACFALEVLRPGLSARTALGGLAPSLTGPGTTLLAAAIVGATVMPHAVYLHSELAARRADGLGRADRRRLLRRTRTDVGAALGVAAAVNVAMLLVAARLLHPAITQGALTFATTHRLIAERMGGAAALIFAVALLASGLSSSGVGTLAGQIVMGGLARRPVPIAVRRAVTAAPALVILACHVPLIEAVLIGQAVLSFGIPFAIIPLFALSADRRVMGLFVTRPVARAAGGLVAAALVALNAVLLAQTF